MNLSQNLFVFGDLNMNWLTHHDDKIKQFCIENDLSNSVTQPIRVITTKAGTSSTLIDVILHNRNAINKTHVINFPYSDHCILLALCKFSSEKPRRNETYRRNLNASNVDRIIDELKVTSLYF